MKIRGKEIYPPYQVVFGIYVIFIITAFLLDRPSQLMEGLIRIMKSRSVLITDYMVIGGIGATLLNAVLVGSASLFLLIRNRVKPNGAIIMALFLTTGFSFFGKNIFNMIPITFGVWLYSLKEKEPFENYMLVALLSATVSPVVSEIAYLPLLPRGLNVVLAILVGILVGFLFPVISSFCVRVHDGYMLYNLGFTGGLISAFIVALLKSKGITIEREQIWATGYNGVLGTLFYLIFVLLIVYGIVRGKRRKILEDLKGMMRHSGRLATDFYVLYGENSYINMGILGILGVSVVLILGGDLNGPTLSGILTIAGFACFGKHLRNVIPVMIGAILGSLFNTPAITSPGNMLAILFCTGLAPIAGQYGVIWGIAAGFLHVLFASHIGEVNQGLNLYNNGFGAGFVALIMVPVIQAFSKTRRVKGKKS